MMYDTLAYLVALVALALLIAPAVPTGILGSLGVAIVGICAAVSTDDQAFANVQWLENTLSALLLAFVLIAAHVALRIRRAHRPRSQHRRADDWRGPQWADTTPGDRSTA